MSYLDNHLDSITAPPSFGAVTPTATANLSSRLPFAPEWQAHIGASYDFHLPMNLTLTPRLDLSYTGSQFFDAGDSPEIAQLDPVTVLNGSLTLGAAKWHLTLSGDNLTDELYPVAGTSSQSTSSGYSEVIYARPRSFWASLTVDF